MTGRSPQTERADGAQGTVHADPPATQVDATSSPALDVGDATVTVDEATRRAMARRQTAVPTSDPTLDATDLHVQAKSASAHGSGSVGAGSADTRSAASVSVHVAGADSEFEDPERAPTYAALEDGAATRREGVDTRQALDEKIRAHLDRGETKQDPLLGQTIAGRFLVLKKIGAGGMGSVYRARQEGMDRDVAIKVLLGDLTRNDTVLRRFTLEALAVSRLRHPNTIQIFDYGQTPDGNPYIAMEFLDGHSLYDLLRKERPLPIRRALRIMAQVAQSLAEAHSKEIVHRDLKPENIFLVTVGDYPDYVKVLDFGVAKLRDHKSEQGTLTQAGSIFGTPRYMSPEQCSAQPVDHRSDLYALGVILYEMITGQVPFNADQALSLLLAHVNDMPRPPSTVTDRQVIPAEVESLVLKLLEKRPEHRVASAGDLARLCEDLAAALPTAFDQHVGSAEEAETLGVRVSQITTDQLPTARTMKMAQQDLAGGPAVPAPVLEMPAAPRNSRAPLLVASVLGLGALAAAGWFATRPPEVVVQREVVTQQVEVPVAVGSQPDDKTVRITVNSNPPGAKILMAGALLGTTNAALDRPRGAPTESWQLVRDGFETQTLRVDFAAAQVFNIELKAAKVVAPEAPKSAPQLVKPGVGALKVDPSPAARPEPAKPEPVKAEPAKAEPVKAEAKPEPKPEPKKKKDDGLVDDLQ